MATTTTAEPATAAVSDEPPITLVNFLTSVAPNTWRVLTGTPFLDQTNRKICTLPIKIYCSRCEGLRVFRESANQGSQNSVDHLLYYLCSNCQQEFKTFAIRVETDLKKAVFKACKFGELPAFGTPVPSRLLSRLGKDREEFLKGRRAENQGLGVAAFTYYRRVVERQKNRLIAEIKKVALTLQLPTSTIATLDSAITEKQFSKALDLAKDVIPESLRIKGHSPLSLLHSALSDGVHNGTDEECLGSAEAVRIILTELSDRLDQALQEDATLTKALDKLLNKQSAPSTPRQTSSGPNS